MNDLFLQHMRINVPGRIRIILMIFKRSEDRAVGKGILIIISKHIPKIIHQMIILERVTVYHLTIPESVVVLNISICSTGNCFPFYALMI